MARIFKPQYPVRVTKTDPATGKLIRVPKLGRDGRPVYRESSKWAIEYRDAKGKRKVAGGFTDKVATEQKAANIEKHTARHSVGIVDVPFEHTDCPIETHVKDWLADLERSGRSPEYTRKVKARVNTLIADREWKRLASIRVDDVTKWLTTKQIAGMGEQTCNHHIDALRSFCNWCVAQKRLERNPVEAVTKANVIEPRCKRRAATPDELARLVAVHPVRGKVYLTAMLTGLRRQELQRLEWRDVVDLESDGPYFALRAATTKSKRADAVPVPPELRDALRSLRPSKWQPTDHIFASIPKSSTVKADLTTAGIKADTPDGKLDFHALRTSYGTMLARSGVNVRTAMELMRHTDIRLTTRTYTDARLLDTSGAVRTLPRIGDPTEQRQKATGTDGKVAYVPAYVSDVPKLGKTVRNSTCDGDGDLEMTPPKKPRKKGVSGDPCGDKLSSQNWRRGESNPRPATVRRVPLRA